MSDFLQQCDDLAHPAGELAGMGAVLGGAAIIGEVAPLAAPVTGLDVAGALSVGHEVYTGVSGAVESNWHDGVCVPMDNAIQTDTSHPFSQDMSATEPSYSHSVDSGVSSIDDSHSSYADNSSSYSDTSSSYSDSGSSN